MSDRCPLDCLYFQINVVSLRNKSFCVRTNTNIVINQESKLLAAYHFKNYEMLLTFRRATECSFALVGLCSIVSLVYQYREAFQPISVFNETKLKRRRPSDNLAGGVKYNWDFTGPFEMQFPQFAPRLNATEYTWYMELISLFKHQCERYNITFYIDFGSLLGTYRHRGFIPYDNDFDVRVNYSQISSLEKALGTLPHHTLANWTIYGLLKFHHNENSIMTELGFRWPYIDIFFYTQNHWELSVILPSGKNAVPIMYVSNVFPLCNENFEGLVMPVPRNMRTVLKTEFGDLDLCRCHSLDHKTGLRNKVVTIHCNKLFNIYPFVNRSTIQEPDRNPPF